MGALLVGFFFLWIGWQLIKAGGNIISAGVMIIIGASILNSLGGS